jgi:hypothetical protein
MPILIALLHLQPRKVEPPPFLILTSACSRTLIERTCVRCMGASCSFRVAADHEVTAYAHSLICVLRTFYFGTGGFLRRQRRKAYDRMNSTSFLCWVAFSMLSRLNLCFRRDLGSSFNVLEKSMLGCFSQSRLPSDHRGP